MPSEQDWADKVMAIVPANAMRQKTSRLCFIPTRVTITSRDWKQALSRLLTHSSQNGAERPSLDIRLQPTI